MDFKLNEMEQEILDMLHDFCIKEVKPIAAELDEKEEFTQNAREKRRWSVLSDLHRLLRGAG